MTEFQQPAPADALPRSPLRVMQILEALAAAPDGMRLAQLSAHLSIPKTSLLSQLRALCQEGYLTCLDTVYRIGPSAIRVSMLIQSSLGGSDQLRRGVAKLAADSAETAILGQLDANSDEVAYVAVVEGTQPLRYSPPVGTRRPLLFSGVGRAMLAHQEAAFVQRLLDGRILPLTPRTITDREELRACLARIRTDGVAVTEGEFVEDLGAIASPIFGSGEKVTFALGVTLPLGRLEAKRAFLTALVRRAATEISHALGGQTALATAALSSPTNTEQEPGFTVRPRPQPIRRPAGAPD